MNASFVILTRGDRPAELLRAIESAQSQEGIEAEIVVISNGAGEIEVPDGAQLFVSRENIGIPGGRNLGAANSTADVMFFLDDDAWYSEPGIAAAVLADFGAETSLGGSVTRSQVSPSGGMCPAWGRPMRPGARR